MLMHSALLTDFYQLTLAQAYFKLGVHKQQACFQLYFRKEPFESAYALASGLDDAFEYVERFQFQQSDIEFLKSLSNPQGQPQFEADFLIYLSTLKLNLDIQAIKEGTPVFAREPLLKVKGPLLQCQLIETPLLTQVNFQTLIATKASRICHAARGKEVVDFGLRRAQGFDGGITASRAAYVGGCHSTSNTMAAKMHGIPLKGTQAHSFIMRFENERAAFMATARTQPNNCILLVDTYNTRQGVKNAIETAAYLKTRGEELRGIRLDSGNLEELSKMTRTMLNAAGLQKTKILASGDLDEYAIADLEAAEAPIDIYGVGTKLITAYDQPALGGVYKLVATHDKNQEWQFHTKNSDSPLKSTLKGMHQVARLRDADGKLVSDVIFHESNQPPGSHDNSELLLGPFERSPSLEDIKKRAQSELSMIPEEMRCIENPAPYTVTLDL